VTAGVARTGYGGAARALKSALVGICLFAGCGAAPAWAQVETSVGAAPQTPARSQPLGTLESSTPLQTLVALRPTDAGALARYATAVSTPGSAVFHRYLSLAEFRRLFAPSGGQVAAVDAALRAQGLDPGPVSANGLLIPVDGNAGPIAQGFGTSLERYRLASGRIAYANTTAPQIASAVAPLIQGVIGLSDLSLPQPLGLERARQGRRVGARLRPRIVTGGPQPCAQAVNVAPLLSAYTADQLASAYNFSSLYGAGDLGAGQTLALLELEPNFTADIDDYQSCYGTSTTVNYVTVDGGVGSGAGSGEAALDIEVVIGLAPQATIDVFQTPNSPTGVIDGYSAMITDSSVGVVSTSWGSCEPLALAAVTSAENTLFQEAATAGKSVFAAAGDTGSTDCRSGPVSSLAVDDPASQPFVTGVGGLTLSSTSYPPSESVWNDSATTNGAGGGGISTDHTMPSYQAAASASLNVIDGNSSGAPCSAPPGSYCREVPDVSADADPATGYLIVFNGFYTDIGGTSAAAPLWAALAAVGDSSSPCRGTSIGFANPGLYGAAASAYSSDFSDVTSGDNAYTPTGYSGSLYPAGGGYDMASGLGSPNGATLPAALCGAPPDAVSMGNPGAQQGTVGTAASVQLTATDAYGFAITFTATGLPAGLSISPGGLISGTPTAAGTSTVTVTAQAATGAAAQATFSWSIAPLRVASPPVPPAPNVVTLSDPGNQSGTVGVAVSLQLSASDSGGAPLTFSASGLPAGLSIGSGGAITGTPTSPGTANVTVTVTDTTGVTAAGAFVWQIAQAPCKSAQLLLNAGFESGSRNWSGKTQAVITNKKAGKKEVAYKGSQFAWLGGSRLPTGGTVSQTVTIPANCNTETVMFWRHIDTNQPKSKGAVDKLTVKLLRTNGSVLKTLAKYSNLNAAKGYKSTKIKLSGYAGQKVKLSFSTSLPNKGGKTTNFCIDDTSLKVP
jgi:hypothetical protein